MRDAGRDLHARGPGEQRGDEVPRRRPAVHVEHPPPVRTTGGVGEDHAEPGDVDVLGGGDLHRAAETERVEVGAGHGHPQLVAVDARDGQPGPRQRHQVAADAAAEVEHRRGGGERDPRRAVRGDPGPGGLLEAVGGEVHPRRVVAELGHRPRPQVDLGQRRGGVLGRDVVAAQGGRGPHRVAGVVDVQVGGPDQQRLAGLGQQPAEGVEVHARHPVRPGPEETRDPSGTRGDRVLDSRWHSHLECASAGGPARPPRRRATKPAPSVLQEHHPSTTSKVEVGIVSVNIKPLEDRIVVKALEAEQTTASGLVIPDTAKEKPQEGEVLEHRSGSHRRQRQPGPARRQRRRQGHLQQVRRHRGQVLRPGVPHPLGARRARRHRLSSTASSDTAPGGLKSFGPLGRMS